MFKGIGIRKLLSAVVASLLFATLPTSISFAASSPYSATCTIEGLVRQGPGTGYASIGTLRSGEVITVLEERNEWYRFSFNGKTGWSSGRYLTLSATAEQTQQEAIGTAVCNVGNMIVRSGPGTSYQPIGMLQKNQSLNLYSESEGWYQIGYGTGMGWVNAPYLTNVQTTNRTTASTLSVSAVSVPTADASTIIGTAVVNLTKGSLNVRSAPGTGYTRIGTITNKTSHNVYAEQDGWLCIRLEGEKGWISKTNVIYTPTVSSPSPSPDEDDGNVFVTDGVIDDSTPIGSGIVDSSSGSQSIRKGPGTNYAVVGQIAKGETVDIMSISGSWYYISFDGSFGYINKSSIKVIDIQQTAAITNDADPLVNQIKGTVKLIRWFGSGGAREIWPKGTYFTMVDVRTGTVMRMKYMYGTNHADIEPLTKEDTAALKKCYGGHWTWLRRPVWVIIDGQAYAGAINGMPHGGDTLPNNGMRGQICLHFVGSKTHCDNKVDPDHQAAIQEAYLAGK